MGVPRKMVVGAVKRETQLAGGVKGVGGEVIREMVKAGPGRRRDQGRQGRMMLRVSSAWGRRRSQRSEGKSGWVEAKVEMRCFLVVLTDFSAGLDL